MTILPRIDHDPIRVPIHSLELSYHIWYGKVDGAIHVGRNRHHLQIIWLFKFTIFVINKTIPGAQKNFRFSEVVSFSIREVFFSPPCKFDLQQSKRETNSTFKSFLICVDMQ